MPKRQKERQIRLFRPDGMTLRIFDVLNLNGAFTISADVLRKLNERFLKMA